jgi:hypothetical protein
MKQKQLAQTIGTSERTLRRMSPTKRKQWQALAAKGRTIAWFDVLAQLMFGVEAFNAGKNGSEWLWLQVSGATSSVTHFESHEFIYCKEFLNIDQLTEALSYVRGLNN